MKNWKEEADAKGYKGMHTINSNWMRETECKIFGKYLYSSTTLHIILFRIENKEE